MVECWLCKEINTNKKSWKIKCCDCDKTHYICHKCFKKHKAVLELSNFNIPCKKCSEKRFEAFIIHIKDIAKYCDS